MSSSNLRAIYLWILFLECPTLFNYLWAGLYKKVNKYRLHWHHNSSTIFRLVRQCMGLILITLVLCVLKPNVRTWKVYNRSHSMNCQFLFHFFGSQRREFFFGEINFPRFHRRANFSSINFVSSENSGAATFVRTKKVWRWEVRMKWKKFEFWYFVLKYKILQDRRKS